MLRKFLQGNKEGSGTVSTPYMALRNYPSTPSIARNTTTTVARQKIPSPEQKAAHEKYLKEKEKELLPGLTGIVFTSAYLKELNYLILEYLHPKELATWKTPYINTDIQLFMQIPAPAKALQNYQFLLETLYKNLETVFPKDKIDKQINLADPEAYKKKYTALCEAYNAKFHSVLLNYDPTKSTWHPNVIEDCMNYYCHVTPLVRDKELLDKMIHNPNKKNLAEMLLAKGTLLSKSALLLVLRENPRPNIELLKNSIIDYCQKDPNGAGNNILDNITVIDSEEKMQLAACLIDNGAHIKATAYIDALIFKWPYELIAKLEHQDSADLYYFVCDHYYQINCCFLAALHPDQRVFDLYCNHFRLALTAGRALDSFIKSFQWFNFQILRNKAELPFVMSVEERYQGICNILTKLKNITLIFEGKSLWESFVTAVLKLRKTPEEWLEFYTQFIDSSHFNKDSAKKFEFVETIQIKICDYFHDQQILLRFLKKNRLDQYHANCKKALDSPIFSNEDFWTLQKHKIKLATRLKEMDREFGPPPSSSSHITKLLIAQPQVYIAGQPLPQVACVVKKPSYVAYLKEKEQDILSDQTGVIFTREYLPKLDQIVMEYFHPTELAAWNTSPNNELPTQLHIKIPAGEKSLQNYQIQLENLYHILHKIFPKEHVDKNIDPTDPYANKNKYKVLCQHFLPKLFTFLQKYRPTDCPLNDNELQDCVRHYCYVKPVYKETELLDSMIGTLYKIELVKMLVAEGAILSPATLVRMLSEVNQELIHLRMPLLTDSIISCCRKDPNVAGKILDMITVNDNPQKMQIALLIIEHGPKPRKNIFIDAIAFKWSYEVILKLLEYKNLDYYTFQPGIVTEYKLNAAFFAALHPDRRIFELHTDAWVDAFDALLMGCQAKDVILIKRNPGESPLAVLPETCYQGFCFVAAKLESQLSSKRLAEFFRVMLDRTKTPDGWLAHLKYFSQLIIKYSSDDIFTPPVQKKICDYFHDPEILAQFVHENRLADFYENCKDMLTNPIFSGTDYLTMLTTRCEEIGKLLNPSSSLRPR